MAGQDGQEANGGSRKATGKRGRTTEPSKRLFSYNWPHTRPCAWARKGADVSRVAL
jgi:hypothetical protein